MYTRCRIHKNYYLPTILKQAKTKGKNKGGTNELPVETAINRGK